MSSPGPSLSQLTNPVCQVIPSSEQLNIAHNMKAILSVGLLFSLIAVSSSAFIGDILLGRIDETLVKVIALEEDIDILEENEKKGKEKIENLEKGQDQANEKLVALEKDIDILEKNGKKEKEKIENLERGQDQANVKVVALEEEIDILEENEKKGGEKIETLENELAQSNLKVGVIQDKIGALGEEIGIIEEKEMKGKERIENLENELAQSNLTNLEDTVGKLENELSDTNNKFDKMEKLLQELISRVDDPCVDDPCGPNSECKNAGGVATSSCLAGYEGSPPSCRPQPRSESPNVTSSPSPPRPSERPTSATSPPTTRPAQDLLFLGTKTVQLPSFSPLTSCTAPPHPVPGLKLAVTGLVNGEVMTCGGRDADRNILSGCHSLQGGVWTQQPRMAQKRRSAAAIMTPAGMMVTGGLDGNYWLATTEYYSGQWVRGPDMPVAMEGHCQVTVDTSVIVTGGYGDGGYLNTVYQLVGNTWTTLEGMKKARFFHSCEHYRGQVVVMGGDADATSVEILDMSTLQWRTGPGLPSRVYNGLSTVYRDVLYLVSKEGVVISLSGDNTDQWQEVGDIGGIGVREVFPAPIVTPAVIGC